jgi:calmodulin
MRRFGQRLNDRQISDMIRSVDYDNNNEIDFDEFLMLMGSKISSDPEYELKMAFNTIDLDGDGTISKNELRALMVKVNQHMSSSEIDAVMRECDCNGDGELDFEEFKELMVSSRNFLFYFRLEFFILNTILFWGSFLVADILRWTKSIY